MLSRRWRKLSVKVWCSSIFYWRFIHHYWSFDFFLHLIAVDSFIPFNFNDFYFWRKAFVLKIWALQDDIFNFKRFIDAYFVLVQSFTEISFSFIQTILFFLNFSSYCNFDIYLPLSSCKLIINSVSFDTIVLRASVSSILILLFFENVTKTIGFLMRSFLQWTKN